MTQFSEWGKFVKKQSQTSRKMKFRAKSQVHTPKVEHDKNSNKTEAHQGYYARQNAC